MSTLKSQISSKKFHDATKIIGDAYILNIIAQLSLRSMRFNELQRSVPDICPATLTDRLKKLEQEQIIIREEETVDKVSVVYNLTPKGKAMLPVIKALNLFSKNFI